MTRYAYPESLGRHAQQVTPRERALICAAIGRELALEYFRRTNSRREIWARLVIGLPARKRLLIASGRARL
jgi:hypothetical protein